MRRLTAALLTALVGLALTAGATPAVADSADEQDPLMTAMLEEVPGGVIVDEGRVVWPRLDMELNVRPGQATVAREVEKCASGRICAFNAVNQGGSSLTFGTCGTHPIPSAFVTRSLANARSSGSVQARNGLTVLATVYPGNWTNLIGTVTTLRCVL